MRKVIAVVFGVCLAATPALAQDKPVEGNIGFGWAFPSMDFKNSFDPGWNFSGGATFFLNPNIGIQAEYMYNRMGGPDAQIQLSPTPNALATSSGIIESNHQIHAGTFNLVYRRQGQDRPVGGFVLGGLGVYHRVIQLTSPSVGYTSYCDPYWLVCYPALVPVDRIIGDRGSTDFGINFGGGVTFGTEGKFYIESRFHYVWGPTVTPEASTLPASTTVPTSLNTNATYFPLVFGYRF
jgi:hypothetical protein